MTYPISSIDGLTAFAVLKLKSAGIRTTVDLVNAAHTAKGRKELSGKTGLSEKHLLEWVNLADCMRVPGMGRAKAELLRASGVNTLRELTHRNPARLALAMREANDKRRLVQVLPSQKSVEKLIEKARELPLKITY